MRSLEHYETLDPIFLGEMWISKVAFETNGTFKFGFAQKKRVNFMRTKKMTSSERDLIALLALWCVLFQSNISVIKVHGPQALHSSQKQNRRNIPLHDPRKPSHRKIQVDDVTATLSHFHYSSFVS